MIPVMAALLAPAGLFAPPRHRGPVMSPDDPPLRPPRRSAGGDLCRPSGPAGARQMTACDRRRPSVVPAATGAVSAAARLLVPMAGRCRSPRCRLEEQPDAAPAQLPPNLRRQEVSLADQGAGRHPRSSIRPNTYLYYVLGNGRAIRYGVRVGRDGFTWTGVQKITRKAEWPDWHPPTEMIERQPYLPRFMAGGPGNPLGARAMYLGSTVYRIHGTNQPSTIGKFVSSGCIGMLNEDVSDLFERVKVGTRVVVMPGGLAAGNGDRLRCARAGAAAGPGPDGRAGPVRSRARSRRWCRRCPRRSPCAKRSDRNLRLQRACRRHALCRSGQLARRLAALGPGVDRLHHVAVINAQAVLGGVAEMRRQHEVVELAERMIDRQRLDREHVEAGARDLLLLQRLSAAHSRPRSARARC